MHKWVTCCQDNGRGVLFLCFCFFFPLSTTIAVSSYVLNASLWGSSSWLDLAALKLDSSVVDCWMRSKAPVFMDQWLSDYNIRFGLFGWLILKRPCQLSIPKPPHLVFFFYELHTSQQPRHGKIYFPQRKKNKMLEGNEGSEFPIAGFRPSSLGISRRKRLRHEWHMNAFDSLIEDLITHIWMLLVGLTNIKAQPIFLHQSTLFLSRPV